MEKELNIAAILKDKPQGTKLYDLLYNVDVELDTISTTDTETVVWCTNETDNNTTCHRGYSEFGTIRGCPDGLQIILPSKEMRDWRKFAWKKGDILVSNDSDCHIIFEGFSKDDYTTFKGKHWVSVSKKRYISHLYMQETQNYHIEDKDAAQTYINTIEERLGGKLNRKTLEIEKQPEFKDGDIVVTDAVPDMCYSKCIFILKGDLNAYEDHANSYIFYNINNNHISFNIVDRTIRDRNIHLATVEEKLKLFDALTKKGKYWDAEKKEVMDLKPKIELKPFDKVLVRNGKDEIWEPAFFFRNLPKHNVYKYQTVGGKLRVYCIPFNEETAKLINTSNDWEE